MGRGLPWALVLLLVAAAAVFTLTRVSGLPAPGDGRSTDAFAPTGRAAPGPTPVEPRDARGRGLWSRLRPGESAQPRRRAVVLPTRHALEDPQRPWPQGEQPVRGRLEPLDARLALWNRLTGARLPWEGRPDGLGAFDLGGVSGPEWELVAFSPSRGRLLLPVESLIASGGRPIPAGRFNADTDVVGRVTYADGRPVAGALLEGWVLDPEPADDPGPWPPAWSRARTRTDAQGWFVCAFTRPGRVRLRLADAPVPGAATNGVAGDPTPLALVLNLSRLRLDTPGAAAALAGSAELLGWTGVEAEGDPRETVRRRPDLCVARWGPDGWATDLFAPPGSLWAGSGPGAPLVHAPLTPGYEAPFE